MRKHFIRLIMYGISGALMSPFLAHAQDSNLFNTANSAAVTLFDVVTGLVKVAFAAILLFFFWGVAKYIWGGAEEKEKAKNLLIWGVIALFVAASIWGIVAVLQNTLGIDPSQTSQIAPKAF